MDKVKDQKMHYTIDEFMEVYEHNYKMDKEYLNKLILLVVGAKHPKMEGWSQEDVVLYALYHYGGTVVEALVDCLWNN